MKRSKNSVYQIFSVVVLVLSLCFTCHAAAAVELATTYPDHSGIRRSHNISEVVNNGSQSSLTAG